MQQRILLVDDKKANLVALESLLCDLPVTLVSATSGNEALNLLLKQDVSLVLLDVQMPEMDGYEVAELIRSRKKTRHIPIIFVTAINKDQSHVFKGYESGGIDFLQKPIEPVILINKVKLFLEMDKQKRMLEDYIVEVEKLKTSNELLLNSVGEGILGVNDEGYITFANPAAEIVLEAAPGRLNGLPLGKEILVSTKGFAKFSWEDSVLYQSCSQGNKYHTDVGAFKTLMNGVIPVEFTATPVSSVEQKFSGIVLIFKDITARKRIETELSYMAQYDNLTGLGNRNLFNLTVKNAVARSDRVHKPFALLFIDLDRFKQVNDTMGHEAGDILLQEASERMKKCLRDSDTVCRLGGDEFTIIIQGESVHAAAERVSEKVIESLATPFELMGQHVYIGASIGIVYYPEMAADANDLVKKADTAMYQAKREGRNCYKVFQQAMEAEVEKVLGIESKLRRSMKDMDFTLCFQPKIRVNDTAVTGVEALIRWSPNGQNIPPDQFIPVAEETGMIDAIGEWVIDEACARIHEWSKTYELSDEFSVSVNVSVKQFKDDTLIDYLKDTLKKYEISPHRLELEITESLLLDHTDRNILRLQEISDMGISIALDDFGTGYSSMSYLTQIPLSVLKIDRSFVSNLGNTEGGAIIQAIVALAKGLSLKVVAEGVETSNQVSYLKEVYCDYGQGYYFSKPLTQTQIEEKLAEVFGTIKGQIGTA